MKAICLLHDVSGLRFLPNSFQLNLHFVFYFPSCFLRLWINLWANIATGEVSVQLIMASELLSRQDIFWLIFCIIEAGPRPFHVISTYNSVTCVLVLIEPLCSKDSFHKHDIQSESQSDAISAVSLLTCSSSPPLLADFVWKASSRDSSCHRVVLCLEWHI
jgi:hypothetical protein